MKEIIQTADELARKHEDFALATVISRDGSAPRGPGAKMLIRKNGDITGTIGGGLIEAEVIKNGINCIGNRVSVIKTYVLSGEKAAGLDMTCGGEARVLIQYIDASNPETGMLFGSASKGIKGNGKILVTDVRLLKNETVDVSMRLHEEGGSCVPEANYSLLREALQSAAQYKCIFSDNNIYIIEALSNQHCVYICGGGHVGLKTAETASLAGFDTVIIDDRQEFANRERFPYARDVKVAENFNNVFDEYRIDGRSYIVILTRGHSYDQEVLKQALQTNAFYIGMIGSRGKIGKIYDNLKAEGVDEAALLNVAAPIGLPIGAETPAEIAVSIVAQLIQKKAGI